MSSKVFLRPDKRLRASFDASERFTLGESHTNPLSGAPRQLSPLGVSL